MTDKNNVLAMDIYRLEVVRNGEAAVVFKKQYKADAFKYQLKIEVVKDKKVTKYFFWVWRSSINYYFIQNVESDKIKGITGGPALNDYLKRLIKTA